MKGILKFLIGGILGAALGWGLGFLRVPALERNASFWVGAGFCLALLLFAGGLFLLGVRHRRAAWGIRQNPSGNGSTRPFLYVWILVGLMVLGGGIGGWMIKRQGDRHEIKVLAQEKQIAEQEATILQIKSGNAGAMMRDLLASLDREMETEGRLRDKTIGRVGALSLSMQPYRYTVGDTLAGRALSPERGQLLLALAHRYLDTASYHRILREAPFMGADLRGAKLQGADLRGANLRGADLRDADLRGANLDGADLSYSDLWGANLDSASLAGANLRRAVLSWTEMNGANLRLANLDGADFSNAKLRHANLDGATAQWSFGEGAMFNEANMSRLDLLGAALQKVNLTGANLTGANLMAIHLDDALMSGAILSDVSCGKDLLDNLSTWRIAEAGVYQGMFRVIDDTIRPFQSAVFRLEKIGQ